MTLRRGGRQAGDPVTPRLSAQEARIGLTLLIRPRVELINAVLRKAMATNLMELNVVPFHGLLEFACVMKGGRKEA